MFQFQILKRYTYNLWRSPSTYHLLIAAQDILPLLISIVGTWRTSVGLYRNVLVGLLTLQLDFEVFLCKNTVMSSLCPPSCPRSKVISKSMQRSGILLAKPHQYATISDT